MTRVNHYIPGTPRAFSVLRSRATRLCRSAGFRPLRWRRREKGWLLAPAVRSPSLAGQETPARQLAGELSGLDLDLYVDAGGEVEALEGVDGLGDVLDD